MSVIGYEPQGALAVSISGAIQLEIGTVGAVGGTVDNIQAYIITTSAKTIKCALYAYVADNDAGVLVGTFTERSIDTDSAISRETFLPAAPITLVAGTKYYLAIWGNGGTVQYDGLALATVGHLATAYGAWPDPLAGESTNTRYTSICCNYTETSANKAGPLVGGKLVGDGILGGALA